MCRNPVRPRQRQDRLRDLRIIQLRNFVKHRHNEHRDDERDEDREGGHHRRSPHPPGSRHLSHHSKQQHREQCPKHQVHQQRFSLISHPRPEGLRREPVLMLAEEPFIDRQRKPQNRGQHEVLDPVANCLQRLEACHALRHVTHLRRPAQVQQHQAYDRAVKKVPEDQPIAALEIRIRTLPRGRRNLRKIRICRGNRIKVCRRLRRVRHLDHVWHFRFHRRRLRQGEERTNAEKENKRADLRAESHGRTFLSARRTAWIYTPPAIGSSSSLTTLFLARRP